MKSYIDIDIYNKEAENWENLETAPQNWMEGANRVNILWCPYVCMAPGVKNLAVVLTRLPVIRHRTVESTQLRHLDHPNAVASNDSTSMTYLYQLMLIRNWGNANLHIT